MKIFIAVHHFPPKYTGGAEWRAYRTALALQERGHQVKVMAIEYIDRGPNNGVAWQDEQYDGVQVRRLSFEHTLYPGGKRWEYDNTWVGDHLRSFLRDYLPDVFHLIGGYLITGRALRVAKELSIPTVVTLTDFWYLCPRISMLRTNGDVSTVPIDPATCARCLGEEKRRYRLPAKILPGLMDRFWKLQTGRAAEIQTRLDFLLETLNQVDAIISPSQFLKQMYVDAGVNPKRIVFSRQGRDFPDLDSSMLEKPPSSRLRIGYMGQLAWLKGVHILFDAVKQYLAAENLVLRVYGDPQHFPDYSERLQKSAQEDPRIEMMGVFRKAEVSRVLQRIDVLVVPSTWYENSPNVILEAFAHRTPVVATNLGGMAELVQHGKNGLLFNLNDPADLALQIRRLLEEPELLASLTAGIGPVKSVSEEIDELDNIYHQVRMKTGERTGI